MAFIKYSQRILNPFRGSMNIIDYEGAEAVSLDGVHWDIYVRNIALIDDLENKTNIQTSDIRYGSWSEDEGLKRGPTYPSADFKKMEANGARVYEALLQHYQQVPFPFLDNYELWLLDKKAQPLALLDSTRCENNMRNDAFLDWRAGQYCCQNFQSKAYASIINKQPTPAPLSAGQYLMTYINQLCNSPPQAQWFKRTMDGHGIGLQGNNIDSSLINRELNDNLFPLFMLKDTDHDNLHINLINDFIQWQSPWLLLLDTLSESQRMIFEEASCKQALMVNQLYHLYPEILDIKHINSARVETLLRKSAQAENKEEAIVTSEYIEFPIT